MLQNSQAKVQLPKERKVMTFVMKLPEAHTVRENSLQLATKQNTSFLYIKIGRLLFTIQITEIVKIATYF